MQYAGLNYGTQGEGDFTLRALVLELHRVPSLSNICCRRQEDSPVVRYTTCDSTAPADRNICADDNLIDYNVTSDEAGYVHKFMTSFSEFLDESTVRAYAVKGYLKPSKFTIITTYTRLIEILA